VIDLENGEATMNLKLSLRQLARRGRLSFYIENDGRPIGETQCHVENVCYLLEPLEEWFRADSQVFVAGALVLHYEKGRRDRYVSPDIFVVRGVPQTPLRRNYLVWEERKGPDMVIELTSELTRDEDQTDKRRIYQDILRVKEYFLFDPLRDYLVPPLQGLRLASGRYRPIRRVKGRLPSKVLGLHLEADGDLLRLYDPAAGRRLPIPPEVLEASKRAEAEVERLRRESEELRRRLSGVS
jgi:Uma2 family endonuclease